MATYYVLSPNIEVTAEVNAPDSRHARTAFLDYLSRNSIIQYSQRQAVRRQLITKRMQPGEIQTTVQLDYDGKPEPITQEIERPRVDVSAGFEPTEEEIKLASGEQPQEVYYPTEEEQVSGSEETRSIFGSSPIMDLSRKSRGM